MRYRRIAVCLFVAPEESAVGLFVSYSSQDRSAIDPLTTALRRARQQVWFDDELGGGEAWWNEILEQIRSCDLFIVALSNHWLESKPCQAELRYAKALERPILPVRIGGVDSMRANPVAALQVIDYQNPSADAGIQLVTAVHALAAQQRPLPSPLPDEPPVPFAYLMRLSTTVAEQNLDPRQQTHLLTELKSGLEEDGDDPTARNDIARLLRMLRDRSDVTYRTRTEIDELLASVDTKPAASHASAGPAPSVAPTATAQSRPFAGPQTRVPAPPSVASGAGRTDTAPPSRNRLLIAGGAALVVVMAIVAAVVFFTQGHSATPSSKPTTAAGAPMPSAGAPTPSASLDSILLSTAEINTAMGTSNIQPTNQVEKMVQMPGTLSNTDCVGALAAIQSSVYEGSGYTAARGQALNADDPPHFVYEAAVSFPSTEQAQAFVKTSADKWQACVGQPLTVTMPNKKVFHWNFANVAGAPPKITQVHTQVSGTRICQHALSAVSNVVIDVVACGAQITGEGSRIADQMAAKVTP
jgi:serine/threonine kinase PknH